MNTATVTISHLEPASVHDPFAAPPEASPSIPVPVPSTRKPKGKIANLTKPHREQINRMLDDGATYASIIEHMASQGVDLNHENLANWYQTGFQKYLAELERLSYQRCRYEAAGDLLKDTDCARLPQAGLQTAAAQIYDLLGHFTASSVAKNLEDDPDKYTRIVNSLSRLARETLALQKYADACAQARAAFKQLLDPKRKLSESETRAIVRNVDQLFGLTFGYDPDENTTDTEPIAQDGDHCVQATQSEPETYASAA